MADIENFICKLNNPQVYSGVEINAVKGEFREDGINICLVFPDSYDIGMSHQGLKILYHLLAKTDGVNVERAFLPDRGSIDVFRNEDIDLFSLETGTPLNKFDLIGISVLTEMSFTNILQVLDLAKIPLLTEDRDNSFPLIIAGGITAAANPEPMRDFLDIFAAGDGEVLFPEILKVLQEQKKTGKKDLSGYENIKGLYIPSLYELKRSGRFYLPDLKGGSIRKRYAPALSSEPFPDGQIVPITNVVFDRLEIEIGRGCPQNCRFCQAKGYYSPYRVKDPASISGELTHSLERTGFESFSMSSLSTGDHPMIGDIIDSIISMKNPCLSVSFPSLRPSTLTDNILSALSTGRKTGITIVPEAGSERLRKVINKDVSDKDILSAVETALDRGWQKIKLYFMIGLPTETDEDLYAVIALVERIMDASKNRKKTLNIHISFSPFVPKPHTVFQWCARVPDPEIIRRIQILKRGLKRYRNIDLDFHKPEKGTVETILARGDRRAGELIYRAFQAGEIFSAWDSEFHYDRWKKIIDELGLGIFLDEIGRDEPLPWDHIDLNFTPAYLKREYERAMEGETTPSCTDTDCGDCKGCGFMYKKIPVKPARREAHPEKKEEIEYNKVRIFYRKEGRFSWLSHLPMMKYIERLIRKSGIPFRCTEGFHPRIKMGAIPPLPVFAKGEDEAVEVFMKKGFSEQEMLAMLQTSSDQFVFNRVEIVNGRPDLNKDLKYVFCRIKKSGIISFRDEISGLLAGDDQAEFSENELDLRIDYSDRGAERFSKIYKTTDPLKQHTGDLTRRKIAFKN